MADEHPSVETARINARQAIAVAVVTGIVTIVTTLIATGTIGGGRGADTGQTASAPSVSAPSVMEAPVQHFSARPTSLDLGPCVAHAAESLQRLGLTGIEQGRYFAWGYRNATTGLVWCHTDEGLVIFLAAGRDAGAAAALAEELRRSF